MILDSLNNTEKIECLHPLFKQAFDYLKSTDFSKVEDGKYELEGSRLYVSVVSIFGKEKKDAAIETHKKYIDIQMPLLGVEKIGWKPGCELQEESTPYNEQKDIAFYIDRPTAYTKIYPGQFAIYFPEDGHAPGIGQVKISLSPHLMRGRKRTGLINLTFIGLVLTRSRERRGNRIVSTHSLIFYTRNRQKSTNQTSTKGTINRKNLKQTVILTKILFNIL